MPTNTLEVLGALAPIVRPEILQDFRRDSCIGSTKVLIEVLKHFGISAEPMPVQAYVYNPHFLAALERGDHPPQEPAELTSWFETRKAWAIGVSSRDVRAYVEFVNSNTKWSVATRLTMLRGLKTLFLFVEQDEECQVQGLKSWARVLGTLPENPRREFMPAVKELRRVRGLFNTASAFGLRNYVVFSLILATGMRLGEICWLRLADLHLDEGFLHVPKEGKTGSRLLPLDEKMVNLFRTWLRRRASIKGAALVPWVFVGRGGVQCNRNTFGLAFRKVQPDKRTRITAHVGRHSFGTLYLQGEGNIERLRLLMGHSSYKTLIKYLHLAQVGTDKMKDEIERVSPLKLVASQR